MWHRFAHRCCVCSHPLEVSQRCVEAGRWLEQGVWACNCLERTALCCLVHAPQCLVAIALQGPQMLQPCVPASALLSNAITPHSKPPPNPWRNLLLCVPAALWSLEASLAPSLRWVSGMAPTPKTALSACIWHPHTVLVVENKY
jgi:hypothetical protein